MGSGEWSRLRVQSSGLCFSTNLSLQTPPGGRGFVSPLRAALLGHCSGNGEGPLTGFRVFHARQGKENSSLPNLHLPTFTQGRGELSCLLMVPSCPPPLKKKKTQLAAGPQEIRKVGMDVSYEFAYFRHLLGTL